VTGPSDEGWILLGYAKGGKVYDSERCEHEAELPDRLPDGVRLGRGRVYWKPVSPADLKHEPDGPQ
jgi:hypothetical protein